VITIEDGWTDAETMRVDDFDTPVIIAVRFTNSMPERVSVITDSVSPHLCIEAVTQALIALGFLASSVVWEAGEAEYESVAFLRNVKRYRPWRRGQKVSP